VRTIRGFWLSIPSAPLRINRELILSHQCQDERYDGGPCSVSRSRLPWFEAQANRIPGRLKDVTDVAKIAPDGQTIEGRMQQLCKDVAEDIKKCANACDTYLKSVGVGVFCSH